MNCEFPDVQDGFRKARGIKDQIANICWIKRFPEKHLLCFLATLKPLTVRITTNWRILQEMGIPDHLTCLRRKLCRGQEATDRTGCGTADWFQVRKGVCQGCILSPCLFNLYANYIMQNARLDEAKTGIKS